jgi:prophage maintenance system killer protein
MTVTVDDADLLLIASAALDHDADLLLDTIDVAALAHVVARAETAATPVDAAAVVLVEIAQRRPFHSGNQAAAWLAAAYVLASNDIHLRIGDAEALALVHAAGQHRIGEPEVAAVLSRHIDRWPHLLRRVGRFLFEASSAEWRPWPNGLPEPVRRRPLPRPALAERRDPPTCPVVFGPWTDGRQSFLVIVGASGVAFFPATDDSGCAVYDVVQVRDLAAGDLVGDWRRLRTGGEMVGSVAAADVRLDRDGLSLDWHVGSLVPA